MTGWVSGNAFLFRADNSDPHGMGQGVAHIPRRAVVCIVSLRTSCSGGRVWHTSSCMCWILDSSSMCCTCWLLCPVYRIAGKCDRIATTLERKQKQSMTIKQENDVSSILYLSIESTKAYGFHALGAGGREFESHHSDRKKSHDATLEMTFVSWLYLLCKFLKWAKHAINVPQPRKTGHRGARDAFT